uniref:Family with sequence similarity 65, member C n=1 Tax=Nothobranchius korthausae TaxID=1143690 RepID=A0A1A8H3M8_9TELE
MVFLPHIQHNFDIKVMEAKGLGWLLVGMVTCASVDFFVAKPQLMQVDITELGTIKLQLEVTWNPFDSSEKMKLQLQSVSKQSVSSRKSSVYSWTAPNTPSFSEKYFLSMRSSTPDILRQNPSGEHEPEMNSPALQQKGSSEGPAHSAAAAPSPLAAALTPGRSGVSGAQRRAQALRLGVVIIELEKTLQSGSCREKELKALEHQVLHLVTILKNDLSLLKTTSSEETLAVEEVLNRVSCLLLEKSDSISAQDILPKAQRSRDMLLFWQECGNSSSSPFFCHVDDFSRILKRRYTHKVKAKQPGQSDKVFSRLLLQLQAPCRLVPCSRSICSPERVSVFQLSAYLKRWSFQDLGEHISCLSREEYILSALNGPKRKRALNKLRRRAISELLPLGFTLQTLGALLIDSNHRVCKAASSCVCRAAGCKSFRNKAVVFYTESLRSPDVLTQLGSCLALKCLRATESVDHISDLWRSEDEDLRSAARETVLSFGKKGHEAFQRMDQLFTEMQEEAYKNQETEITIL